MKLNLLLILMAITVGYCGKNKTDWSEWRKVFEQGEGSSRPSKMRRTSPPTQQQPANPRPVNPRPVNPRPVNPRPVNPRPVNPRPVNPRPVNPPPVNPRPVNQHPVNPRPVNPRPVNPQPGISECECGRANLARQARIVGGKKTKPHRYPWAAFVVQNENDLDRYGAIIITNWHLLTVAHAVSRALPKDIMVTIGVHNFNDLTEPNVDVGVNQTIIHPEYIYEVTKHNDIAIIITNERMDFNARIGPACLPKTFTTYYGQMFKALGWGLTLEGYNEVLREVDLQYVPYELCVREFHFFPNNTVICAMGPDMGTCAGDSGGSLLYQGFTAGKYTAIGVIAFGGLDCKTKPSASSDIRHYMSWISEVIVGSNKGVTACYGV